jgi:hypothetical protein
MAAMLLSEVYDRPGDVPPGLSVFYMGDNGAAYGITLSQEEARAVKGYEEAMYRWRYDGGQPEREPFWCQWQRDPFLDDEARGFMAWERMYSNEDFPRECTGCGEKRPHDKDDYICLVCRRMIAA